MSSFNSSTSTTSPSIMTSPASSTNASMNTTTSAGARSAAVLRTHRACGQCRIRKRKCDGQQPCRGCRNIDAVCSYGKRMSLDRRAVSRSYMDMLDAQLEYTVAAVRDLHDRLRAVDPSACPPLNTTQEPTIHDIVASLGLLKTDRSRPAIERWRQQLCRDCRNHVMTRPPFALESEPDSPTAASPDSPSSTGVPASPTDSCVAPASEQHLATSHSNGPSKGYTPQQPTTRSTLPMDMTAQLALLKDSNSLCSFSQCHCPTTHQIHDYIPPSDGNNTAFQSSQADMMYQQYQYWDMMSSPTMQLTPYDDSGEIYPWWIAGNGWSDLNSYQS